MLVLLLVAACDNVVLPEVPAFETLGFAQTLPVIERQVAGAYQRWQESPEDADRNGYLGMLLSAYAKNATAEILFRRARLLAPEDFRWTYYQAVTLSQLGRYDEAIELYRAALAIDPDYEAARIKLAALLLQTNNVDQSIALYKQITADLPERVEGWLGLGKALNRHGDQPGAKTALLQARKFGRQYGEVRYALASVLRALGEDAAAAAEFAAYERRAGNAVRTPDLLTLRVIKLNVGDGPLMSQADYQLRNGWYAEAARIFRAVLEINPVNQDAWGGLVHALSELDQIEETGEAYRAALAAGIEYRRLHLTYGKALRKWGQLDDARAVMVRAIELDPQYADALLALGNLELQRGNGTAAIEYLGRYLAAAPNDRRVTMTLAKALNANGQHAQAVAWLEPLAKDSDFDSPLPLQELALAYHGVNRRDEAVTTLRRAREGASRSANVLLVKEMDAQLAQWSAGGDQ